jgi:hypothetical protein
LIEVLKAEFSDGVTVVEEKDPERTGNFEITLLNTGALLHSKSTKGQGKCEVSDLCGY